MAIRTTTNVPTMTVLMSNSPRRGNQPTWVISVPRRLSIRHPPMMVTPRAATPTNVSTRNAVPRRALLAPRIRSASQLAPAANPKAARNTRTSCQPRPGLAAVTWRTKSQASNASVPMIRSVIANVVNAATVSTTRARRSRNRRPLLVRRLMVTGSMVVATVKWWFLGSDSRWWKRTARPGVLTIGWLNCYSPPSRVPVSRASHTA